MRVASCHGRLHREAIILRREHGGGLSYIESAETEEVEEDVRDLEDIGVEEAMLIGGGAKWNLR